MSYRTERDSMGEIEVPADALYGAQTQRALNNFTLSPQCLPEAFVRTLILVKKKAAQANRKLQVLDTEVADPIIAACQQLLDAENLLRHFPVSIYQTGSGTSTNMNANEVIAHLATQHLASQSGKDTVHPNDHVNAGQSSNDVIPTCIHVSSALELHRQLLPALAHFIYVTEVKAESLRDVVKTGRTHLMDAMPVRMDQTVNSWAQQIAAIQRDIERMQPAIQTLAQGGTAVGTGINAHPAFSSVFCQLLSEETGLTFTSPASFFTHIGTQDTAVALSGQLKTLAVALTKIANDLRWMNSGPLAGIGEIQLKALQPGSSIMPGKVNPVIPEAVLMACAQALGNDLTITLGGQSGNFELNVMLPLIAHNLLETMDLLSHSARALADQAIVDFAVNYEQLQTALARNPILVTALNAKIGYEKAAEIAKQAYRERRPVIDVAEEHTDLSREVLEELMDPKRLTDH